MDHFGLQALPQALASIAHTLAWLGSPEGVWWVKVAAAGAVSLPAISFLATGRKAEERRHWRI